MKRSYLVLALAIALTPVALTVAGRSSRSPRAPKPEAPAAPAPSVAVAIEVSGGAIEPVSTSVPKSHRVALAVTNRGAATARVTLSGYEDVVQIPPLRPGERWAGEFLASRPGGDFAWVVNGEPAGRFSVTGAHLAEGHR